MNVTLRTALQWLTDHDLSDDAECWVLSGDTVEPIVGVTATPAGDVWIGTAAVWSEPAPIALRYGPMCDTLLETYSGGGSLRWANSPGQTYRGSYTPNPDVSVFLLFLPTEVRLVESHEEQMEKRKQQAKQLTREI